MGFLSPKCLGLQWFPSGGRDSGLTPKWDVMASDTGGGQCEDLAKQEGSCRLGITLAAPPPCHHAFGSRVRWRVFEAAQELVVGEGAGVKGAELPLRVLTPWDGHTSVCCVPLTLK